ncbi:MAG: UDP-N-acetylmuramoyl-tripeptide--D-alanyl-D-alanine ligase [Gammaproteobacteria bacterium]|nr:UDP-N-acetylmuramoyl-tripeptide--D-alanyl-D-alanine ligase [Gammaproteobacteria bacterium]
MSLEKSTLWTWSELCEALSLDDVVGPEIQGISIDSRLIKQGELFVALSGKPRPQFNVLEDSGRDGHDFIASAVRQGATGILAHRSHDLDTPTIYCDDTLSGLWDLARYRRSQLEGRVVAVTGSSGKTTMKSFLSQALECPASEGSLNNHIGVPLSIGRTSKYAAMAVYEIGTNHPGEIEPLSKLARPHVAVVLNVLNAHIGNFANIESLRNEKLSIGEGVEPNGCLVVHEDLIEVARMRYPNLDVRGYGLSKIADYHYDMLDIDQVELSTINERVKIPGGGEHRAATMCATAAVLDVLGERAERLRAISEELPPGRGRTFNVNGIRIIDESYNANPESMRKCLEHLARQRGNRRIALVGEMAELGDQKAELHASLVDELNMLDGVISVGSAMNSHAYEHLKSHVKWGSFNDITGLTSFCAETLKPDDVLLVKGSNTVFWTRNFVPDLVKRLGA